MPRGKKSGLTGSSNQNAEYISQNGKKIAKKGPERAGKNAGSRGKAVAQVNLQHRLRGGPSGKGERRLTRPRLCEHPVLGARKELREYSHGRKTVAAKCLKKNGILLPTG